MRAEKVIRKPIAEPVLSDRTLEILHRVRERRSRACIRLLSAIRASDPSAIKRAALDARYAIASAINAEDALASELGGTVVIVGNSVPFAMMTDEDFEDAEDIE